MKAAAEILTPWIELRSKVRRSEFGWPDWRNQNYSAAVWHKARLELECYMRSRGCKLPEEMRDDARRLFGTLSLSNHFCPPWAIDAELYVGAVYQFIEDADRYLRQEIERNLSSIPAARIHPIKAKKTA